MNKVFGSLVIAALVFLSISVGAAIMYFEFGPFRTFNNAFLAADALLNAERRSDDINVKFVGAKPANRFDKSRAPARDGLTGLTRHVPERSMVGYTMYATGLGESLINLVDMDGNLVHQWVTPVDDIYATAPQRERLIKELIHATPYLLPGGDLLVTLAGRGITPWGLGIARLNKDSELVWYFNEPAHHDLDVAPDGRIYTLGHFIEATPREGLENIQVPFIDDTVIVLAPDGTKLREFSVLDAIRDSEYQAVLRYADPNSYNGDILHANSVQYIDEALAAASPIAEPGDLLISLRNMNTLILIDSDTEKVTWAVTGDWHLQHDPDLLPNGNILVFDNQGDLANDGSRVIEFDPVTMEQVWVFPADSGEVFYSSVKSSQQRLPNGNTLMTETNNGRILEATPENEVVWEFYIPERQQAGDDIFTKAVEARRYSGPEVDFPFNGGTAE